jgi:CubicO group peptidase (beta-lactamase class C family)
MPSVTHIRTPLHRRRSCAVFMLALLFAGVASAAWAEQRQSSGSARLPAAAERQIDALLDDAVDSDGPGCVVGVSRGTTVLYARARGMASIELGVRLTPESVMDIGSISKQFTAMILLMLVDEGRLSLEDDIRSYVPELPDYGVKITLDHLLHHTSGVRDYANLFGLAGMADETPLTQEDALALVVRQRRLNFAPGEDAMYSNSNYLLLTIAAERVTGRSMDLLYRERIFTPLAMSSTIFRGNVETIVAGGASSYSDDGSGRYGAWSANGYLRGVGGINTTVGDLSRWMANYDHHRIGDTRLMRRMQEPGALANGAQIPYGAGVIVDAYRGLSRITHNGGSAGYRATVTRYPDSAISISVLCNTSRAAPHRMSERIADLIFADELAPQARETRQDVSVFEGVYHSEDRDEYRILSVEEAGLRLMTAPGNNGFRLSPLGGGRFRPADLGPEVMVWEDAEGVPRLVIPDTLSAPVEYRRVGSMGLWRPTDLSAYTGAFFSEDLGVTWSIRQVEDGLELRRGSIDPVGGTEANFPLVPIVSDTFISASGIVLTFAAEPGPRRSFSASASRLVGLFFQRAEPQ